MTMMIEWNGVLSYLKKIWIEKKKKKKKWMKKSCFLVKKYDERFNGKKNFSK